MCLPLAYTFNRRVVQKSLSDQKKARGAKAPTLCKGKRLSGLEGSQCHILPRKEDAANSRGCKVCSSQNQSRAKEVKGPWVPCGVSLVTFFPLVERKLPVGDRTRLRHSREFVSGSAVRQSLSHGLHRDRVGSPLRPPIGCRNGVGRKYEWRLLSPRAAKLCGAPPFTQGRLWCAYPPNTA